MSKHTEQFKLTVIQDYLSGVGGFGAVAQLHTQGNESIVCARNGNLTFKVAPLPSVLSTVRHVSVRGGTSLLRSIFNFSNGILRICV